MNRFRYWSRRAWILHGYLIATLLLPPFSRAHAYWTDTNNDGIKEEVSNPAQGDEWWNEDADSDNLTNAEEIAFGSDPYALDSDHDGLTDYVEFIYSQPAQEAGTALPYDPWLWDSDGDGFSDFDAYYQQIQGYVPVVNYLNLPAGWSWAAGTFYTYADADGDGIINAEDSDPLNMDRDGDGLLNWNDTAYMDDANNGYEPPSNDPPTDPEPPADSDGDGNPDTTDPFPYGSFWYNGMEYGGTWLDSDGDGIPDQADVYPNDPTDGTGYFYDGSWFAGPWTDQDNDGIPDALDSYPNDPTNGTSYYYNGSWYSGDWADADGDGIPDPADPYPNDAHDGAGYYFNGTWYDGSWADADGDGIPDSLDSYPNDYYNGSYFYNGNWYDGPWADADGDGIPDPADAYPNDVNNGVDPNPGYYYNNSWYSGTWSDADGDGIPDPADAYPDDPNNGSVPDPGYDYNGSWYSGTWVDSDGDGIPDPADGYPNDANNGVDPNPGYYYNGVWYAGDWVDSDGDGIPDSLDSYPYDANNGSYYYNGNWYTGPWSDRDGDGIPDPADGYPDDSSNNPGYSYNGAWYSGSWADSDGDGIPDPADSYPSDPNNGVSYYYNGNWYSGSWSDRDGDGIPDPADSYPDDASNNAGYNYNGTWYYGTWTDSDGDGIPDAVDGYPYDANNGGYYYNGSWYAGTWADTDGDGIPDPADSDPTNSNTDGYTYNGTWYSGAWSDYDNDGIPDPADNWLADPENGADGDGDGLTNYDERTQFGTDPTNGDTDRDGLSDFEELYTWHKDPLHEKTNPDQVYTDYYMVDLTDTDADGIPDRIEQWYVDQGYGMDPNDPNDAGGDLDGDGYTNLRAYLNGWNLVAAMDHYDGDGDSIPDVLEDAWSVKYPGILSKTEFNDAVQDYDGDGVMNFEEIQMGLDPGNAHSRSPAVSDMQEWVWRGLAFGGVGNLTFSGLPYVPNIPWEWYDAPDTDGDGLPDGLLRFVTAISADPALAPLPYPVTATDYDGDGMPDLWEYTYHLDLRNPGDKDWDNDSDGMGNLDEYLQGRDPTLNDSPPQVFDSALPDGIKGSAYDYTLNATCFSGSYTISLSADSVLPAGLSMNSQGNISGTPTENGDSSFTVKATNQYGVSADYPLTLKVNYAQPQFITTGLPDGSVNANYNASLEARSGTAPYWFSCVNGTLPYGLNMSTDGSISGTPSQETTGTFTFQVTDYNGQSTTHDYTITIGAEGTGGDTDTGNGNGNGNGNNTGTGGTQPLVITTTALQPGIVGGNYSAKLAAANGIPPYTFSLVDGTLPFGFTLDLDGTLTGVGNSAGSQGSGSFTLTFQVNDAAGQATTKQLALVLATTGGSTGNNNISSSGPELNNYGTSFTATNGVGPYTLSTSDLPGGVTADINGDSLSLSIPDRPEGNGWVQKAHQITITVTDDNSQARTITTTVYTWEQEEQDPPDDGGEGTDDGGGPDIDPPGGGGSNQEDDPPEDDDPPPDEEAFIAHSNDGAGPRYRKVGLNGVPMSDDKPQVKDESGEVPEETYIDSYSRALRHGVSDVYAKVDSSLLPLVVRRDVAEEIWTTETGYLPQERPDRPFGAGWTSNLSASVHLENNGKIVTVTDEQGASQSFFLMTFGGTSQYLPSHAATLDAKSRWNTLQRVHVGPAVGAAGDRFIYKKKYGTTCTFDFATEQVTGTNNDEFHQFYRLTEVSDRLNNRLKYEYPNSIRVIPKRIYDPDRPGREINIRQDSTKPRVTQVQGPGGETTTYTYVPENLNGAVAWKLTAVNHLNAVGANVGSVGYDYSKVKETSDGSLYWHVGLQSITDELGNKYEFSYQISDWVRYVKVINKVVCVLFQRGVPQLVSSVKLPNGAVTTFGGQRQAIVRSAMDPTAFSLTTVSSPAGQTTYLFTGPMVHIPQATPGEEHDPNRDATISFTRMDIIPSVASLDRTVLDSSAKETYWFDWANGMGLASATDLSGNTTVHSYADGFDDPVRETNALGEFKTFTYETTTRVMNSITDERGVQTVMEVEPLTGRILAERIYDVDGTKVGETLKEYHPQFRGFMTKQTVKALAPAEGAGYFVDHVTQFVPDAQGRVWKQIGAPGVVNATTIYLYDGSDNKITETDPLGNVTQHVYDSRNRMVRVINADGTHKDMVYDDHGNLTQESNENGVKTFNEYDALHRHTKTTVDLNGNGAADAPYTSVSVSGLTPAYNGDIVTTTTYNARNQVLTQTDALGKVVSNTYDALGRTLSTSDGGYVTSFEYGENSGGSLFDSHAFKPTKVTDPRGMETFNEYDALYRVVTKSSSIGGTTTNTYDAAGHPLTVTDPLNRTTTNTYDAHGQLLTTTYPDGTGIQNFYTQTGKVWKTVDEMGDVNLTVYDALDRTYKHYAPAVDGQMAVTESTYDAAGNLRLVTDPLGRITETQYNSRGKPVKVISPAVTDASTHTLVQPVTLTEYDNMLQVTKVTDPMGAVTQKFYDLAGRLWKTTDALGQSTKSALDCGGNATAVLNAAGQLVHNTYDLHSHLVQTVDAENVTNSFVYDAAGNKISISDGLGQTTLFEYDLLNRLTKQTFANGDTFTYTYDEVHKLSYTDCKGALTTYEYNDRDKQTKTTFYPASGGQTPDYVREMTYDDGGRLTLVTETGRPQATVSYTYDAHNRMTSETSNGVVQQYTYDLAGNRTQVDHGTGRVVQTTYDAMNRPLTISEGGRSTHYGYDKGGHAVMLVAANGQVTNNTYDVLGRVVDRTLFSSASMTTVLAEFDWTYDVLGNMKVQKEVWPGASGRATGLRTTTLTYDGANRLRTELVDAPSPEGLTATTYTYDAANNRSSKTVTGGSEPGYWGYTYNNANQLTGWQKSNTHGGTVQKTATLTYDANGNRDSQTIVGTGDVLMMSPPPAGIGTTLYAWDTANKLIGVTMPNGHAYSYSYDYRGRRVGIGEGGTIAVPVQTAVVFSDGLSVAEYESVGGASVSADHPTVEYTRGPDMGGGIGGMLYTARGGASAGAAVIKYDISNARGDIVAQSNQSAALTWSASYEAFGRRMVQSGSNADKQRANTKDEDPTGLLNEGFRYRDLETGVFLSRDPAGFVDGPNVYTYVQQNPWTKFDPEGLFWHIAVAAFVGAAISVAAQAVSDVASGHMSDFSTYAGAAAGGAVSGAVLAATGSPTLAGAAGGAAQSATEQFAKTGTVDGGQVLHDAAVGAAGGKLGAVASKVMGCATNKVVKALGGAAADAVTGAGTQVVDNVLSGNPPMEGTLGAAVGNIPGMGVVTAVMQRESCFLAGTSVTLGSGAQQMIETLRLGQRVSTPESVAAGQSADSATEVNPSTWRSYKVRLHDARTGWDVFEIGLLRPQGWMAEHSRQIAGHSEVWVDFEELHASGWAEVIQEGPCPSLASGPGRVVTATVTHANDDVRTLTLDGGETLYVTGNHRMYSASARDWVAVKNLVVGEELQTSSGRKSVSALEGQQGRHQVYNIEVEAEHCYFVGEGQTLTHNGCSPTASQRPGVKPYETGTYEELNAKAKPGDNLVHDHQPSHASNVANAEAANGGPLTAAQIAEVRNKGMCVAVPKKWHEQQSRTYGGRNTPQQIAHDASNPSKAARLDSQKMINGASPRNKAAAKKAATVIRRKAGR